GAAPTPPSMADLDADQDGKVTRAELATYYRKHGLAPFQFQLEPPQANLGIAAFLGGGSSEPSVQAVSEAIFALLDTNQDGKLTPDELAAARDVRLRLDEDDDEIVPARERVPDARPAGGMFAGMPKMGGGGKTGAAAGNRTVVPVKTPGEAPAEL